MSWKTEYPRVLLKRDNITILDEGWTLNGTKINMPYPPQSDLSGYGQKVKNHLSYEVAFEVLEWDENEDIVLHFGAVDQVADVYVNQIFVGHHEGGYLPFSFHIAKALKPNYNILQVDVTDTLNRKYPYGKQSRSPHGMWYTQVSGIWQSVWLERVPRKAIKALYISTTMTTLTLDVDTTSATYDVVIKDADNQPVWQKEGIDSTVTFTVDFCEEGLDMKLWDTEHPYLYNLELFTKTDHVYSYFGLREIKVLENNQIALNNQPVFLHGILDQGYFPDGIFLPKDPGEYEKDVLRMKELGFNMIRKHVKVEPEQFYYACDKHGMLVLQDMVNNGGYHYILDTVIPTLGGVYRYDKWPFYEKRKEFFLKHSLGIVKHVKSHPCVIGYTIFNEGWGQFHADDMYELIKEADPNRLVDATSGWFMQSKSDFNSVHIYFRNEVLPKTKKPLFLSECGGYVREVEGHLFHGKKSYGYGKAQDLSSFMDKIEKLYNEMVFPSIQNGLVGLVYTQLCDVETEMNGLYTYDRTVCKVDKDKMRTLSQKCKDLYLTNK